jgi:hypothetical protein
VEARVLHQTSKALQVPHLLFPLSQPPVVAEVEAEVVEVLGQTEGLVEAVNQTMVLRVREIRRLLLHLKETMAALVLLTAQVVVAEVLEQPEEMLQPVH